MGRTQDDQLLSCLQVRLRWPLEDREVIDGSTGQPVTQLGARPGDQLEDLFPGSGAIGEAWRRYTSQPLSERGETAA